MKAPIKNDFLSINNKSLTLLSNQQLKAIDGGDNIDFVYGVAVGLYIAYRIYRAFN